MAKVVVRISLKNAQMKAEVEGVVGDGCEDVTKFLDEAFGDAESVEHKESYYEEDDNTICDGLAGDWCG